jgi:RNA polymerase sigma-70 factor (ECF subfamily)
MDVQEPTLWPQLIARIQSGDRTAEEELARFFHPRVRALVSARLRDSHAGLEVAQECVLAVLLAARNGQIREPERLPAFIYGTARNMVNNHFRSRSASAESDPPAAEPAVHSQQFEEQAEREQRSRVRAALEKLNLTDKRILLYVLVEGMNPREIAPLVGLSAENVRTRKSRALKQVVREIRMSRNPAGNHSTGEE